MNKNILLNLISLLKAINDNNITNTIQIVDYINNNLSDTTIIDSTLLISSIDQMSSYNQSLDYTVNNLNNIKDIEDIKWFFHIKNLIIDKNNLQLEKEIENYLSNNIFNEFRNNQLNQVSVIINRPDLLLKIKSN